MYLLQVHPCGHALKGVGLRPLACWDFGFESRRGVEVCLLTVLCVVRYRSLHQADHSARVFLPSVVCLCVIVKHR